MADYKYKRVLLKISGEGLCREGEFGIDGEQLDKIAGELKSVVDTKVELALVLGGGNFVRGHELAARSSHIQPAAAHSMGMLGTVINALAIQETLEYMDVDTRVQSAIASDRVCEKFIRRRAIHHLEKGRVVILAGGTGNPFVTTDAAAALRGTELDADVVMKATKVNGVYSADPYIDKNAEFFEALSYDDVISRSLKIMDLSAIQLAQENTIPIIVFNLMKHGNMLKAIQGRQVGTLISAK